MMAADGINVVIKIHCGGKKGTAQVIRGRKRPGIGLCGIEIGRLTAFATGAAGIGHRRANQH